MVVSAPNSAARKRSRPSNSAARDSRVPDGMPEAAQVTATAASNGAASNGAASNGRAAKAREELAAVPTQDPPAKAAADDLDGDADLDGDDLAVDVDLEDFEDIDEEALAVDLEIVDTPDADLVEADLPEDADAEADPAEDADPVTPAVVGENAGQTEGKASGGDGAEDEIFVFGDDDDDLPAAQVAVAGATADPVKDYLDRKSVV